MHLPVPSWRWWGNRPLNRITEIGIGIRNPYAPEAQNRAGLQYAGVPSLDAEVWVNELRVSGFEDQSGWAANVRSQVVLADFANVSATLNRSTDGFGSIDSQLGNRQNFDRTSYDLTGTVNIAPVYSRAVRLEHSRDAVGPPQHPDAAFPAQRGGYPL